MKTRAREREDIKKEWDLEMRLIRASDRKVDLQLKRMESVKMNRECPSGKTRREWRRKEHNSSHEEYERSEAVEMERKKLIDEENRKIEVRRPAR